MSATELNARAGRREAARPDILSAALALAGSGWPVFACGANKRPVVEHGFLDATTDPTIIRKMFAAKRAILIGVPTGPASGFDALDLDCRHGAADWEAANAQRLPATRVHQTGSGGRHLLFQCDPRLRNSAGRIAPGVNVRATGGYVIVPPSTGYTVINELLPEPWPGWLLEPGLALPKDKPRPISSGAYVPASDARHEGYRVSILANVRKAADGQKHQALRNAALALGGIAEAAGFSDDEAVSWLMDALPPSVRDWNAAKNTAAWGLIAGREKPITLPDRPNPRAPTNGTRPAAEAQPAPVLGNGRDHDAPAPAADADPPPKKPKKKGMNALALVNFMAASREWRGALRINLFTETLQVCDPFPPSAAPAGAFRPLKEPSDLLEAMLHFQGLGFPKASKGLVWDALCVIAHRNAFHPVQNYLNGLRWDGEPRLGRLFQEYFNAELPDETDPAAKPGEATPHDRMVAYLEHTSQCFMVSAVARIRKPGCKVDYLPVLVGPQGYHKSTAIRALCADAAWFSDDLGVDLVERDTKESLTGKWLVELAEMPHAKKEVERVKAFFSRQTDRYRRAYDRTTNDWPRQCVFMGSSNDLELIDNTGNRRTWPVEIAGPIDIARVTADRDQLWAEAVALYESGYPWWLSANIEQIAGEQQSRFQDEDIWTGELSKWAEGRNRFTLGEAMTGALSCPDPKLIPKADQNRASGCLKSLGFRRRQSRSGATTRWLWTREEVATGP